MLIGIAIIAGFTKGDFITAEKSYNWESKPVMVNVQVDLEQESDQFMVDNILNAIEKHNGYTAVFVTGEFASREQIS